MCYRFTAVVVESGEGRYVGYVEELPATVFRGATIDDVLTALRREAKVTLTFNRRFTRKAFGAAQVVKRVQIKVGS